MAAYWHEAELYNVIPITNQIVPMHILKALGHDISNNRGIKINSITRFIARYRTTRLCGHSAVYHRKLGPRTIIMFKFKIKFSDKRLAYIVTQWCCSYSIIISNNFVYCIIPGAMELRGVP